VILIVGSLFKEAIRAQISAAGNALPSGSTDFFDPTIGADNVWMIYSDGNVAHNLIHK